MRWVKPLLVLILSSNLTHSTQSFFIISALMTMLVTFVTILVAQLTPATRLYFNNIPSGPIAIMFAALYQYARLVPPAYHFRIFGLAMSDKVWVYALAAQVRASLVLCFSAPSSIPNRRARTSTHVRRQR